MKIIEEIKTTYGLFISLVWVLLPLILYVVGSYEILEYEQTVLTFLIWLCYTVLFILWNQ